MPETWFNYWYYGKDGKLIKTERSPRKDIVFVYETAERPTAQISRHTFFCPTTGVTQKLDAVSQEDRTVKRREIVRQLLGQGLIA
jgi:hypothetical protein